MEVMALVRDVNETLATIKGNVKRTSEVLAAWVANPMFDRKEGKVCGHLLLSTLSSWCIIISRYTPYCKHIASLTRISLCPEIAPICCLPVKTNGKVHFAGAQL